MPPSDFVRRVERLEARMGSEQPAYVWLGPGVTAAEAVAHRYPAGVPANLVFFGWLQTPMDSRRPQ